jgi:hypothetical protein
MSAIPQIPKKLHSLTHVPADKALKDAEKISPIKRSDITLQMLSTLRPHPELGGKRLRLPGEPAIYLIDPEGYRHVIPDPYTYNRIFRDWNGIFDDAELYDIPDAGPLSFGASVIRGDGTAPVYFVSAGTKRHISSPAVMDKCNFRWPSGGDVVGPAVVNAIPTGPEWNVPIP